MSSDGVASQKRNGFIYPEVDGIGSTVTFAQCPHLSIDHDN